jgi:hypothetical protein
VLRAGLVALTTVAVVCAAAATAWASATITSPTQGQAVTLTATGQIPFHWLLPSGETEPEVEFAMPPSALGEPGEGLGFYCGAQMERGLTETACAGNPQSPEPVPAGNYDAYITTVNAEGVHLTSPEVGFTVPVGLNWGCGPYFPKCGLPQVQNSYLPHGDGSYGAAFTTLVLNSWTNGPRVTVTFTIARGTKVIKHLRMARSLERDTGLMSSIELYHLRGVRPGTRLSCTVAISTNGASLTRTVAIRSGGGPKMGTISSLSTGG